MVDGDGGIRAELRRHLRERMAARDRGGASALRSAIAAIENAEAQPSAAGTATDAALAAPVAAGAGDVARREVGEAEARSIVVAEIAELDAAADEYRAAGTPAAAEPLVAQAS